MGTAQAKRTGLSPGGHAHSGVQPRRRPHALPDGPHPAPTSEPHPVRLSAEASASPASPAERGAATATSTAVPNTIETPSSSSRTDSQRLMHCTWARAEWCVCWAINAWGQAPAVTKSPPSQPLGMPHQTSCPQAKRNITPGRASRPGCCCLAMRHCAPQSRAAAGRRAPSPGPGYERARVAADACQLRGRSAVDFGFPRLKPRCTLTASVSPKCENRGLSPRLSRRLISRDERM